MTTRERDDDRELLVRDAYLRALAIDPDNRPARLNLAALDLRSSRDEVDEAQAVQDLEDLRAGARRAPASGPVSFVAGRIGDWLTGVYRAATDPVWWHATYMLAAVAANRDEPDRAAWLARPAVRTGLRALRRPRVLRSALGAFAVASLPPLAVLTAGTVRAAVEPPRRRRWNLWFLLVLRVSWDVARWRRTPPPGTAQRLVDLVHALPGALDAPTRYTLACLYATWGPDEAAVRELRIAVATLDEDLLGWALLDPALAGIRDPVVDLVVEERGRRARVRAAVPRPPTETQPPQKAAAPGAVRS